MNIFSCATHNTCFYIIYMAYGMLLSFIFACNQLPYPYCPASSLEHMTKEAAANGKVKKNNSKLAERQREPSPYLYPYPLHKAVCDNNYNDVVFILKTDSQPHINEADRRINQKDDQGYFPIHWTLGSSFASATGGKAQNNLKILRLLLPYLNSSQIDQDGMTILHWAVYHKHLNAIKDILKYFRKNLKRQFFNFINQKDKNGFTALHNAVDRDEKGVYTEKQLQILKVILQYSGKHIDTKDNNGMTVLHWAVAVKNLRAIEEILAHAKSTLKPKAYKEFIRTPTHINDETGEGACPAIYFTTDPQGSRADEQDARETSLKIFNLLLTECDMNYQDNQGYTIAHWAAVQGRNDMLKMLIERGIDLSIQDKKGRTVLHTTVNTIDDARKLETWQFIKFLTHKPIVSASNPKELVLIQYHAGVDNSILTQLLGLEPSRIGFYKKDIYGQTASALERKYNLFKEPMEARTQQTPRHKTNKRPNYDGKRNNMTIPLKKRKPWKII